eukprot:CAMPEP_0172564424 /NCGR_PEP_ID=MMETSP1067-20121228/104301_1 /TAXON_ID=265564 ORGANISM="Thalassiosira punctigera, Strain Tpunct2005C2" /NCGR_SAMPLE_ID=MMETSP1067 /ASSEMBLY_ACC=CAM_ASM_000444 /LENGTH=304 /DNA_ID=CAMNT_0013355085 /DNA_START=168 /DNA_END=1082 /DNA_ORIENTATION=+
MRFLSTNPTSGSPRMRGGHFINAWQEMKSNHFYVFPRVTSCTEKKCSDVCVYVGPCHNANKSCCKIEVLDMVDKYLYKTKTIDATLHLYDALVVNSEYMKEFFRAEPRNYTGQILVLPHHSDPRLTGVETVPNEARHGKLQFGFMGSIPSLKHTDNFLHLKELKQRFPISLVDTDQGDIPPVVDHQMDVSIRPQGSLVSKFKTSAKLATAATLGHNIITTWEAAVRDSLPPDYPYILRNDTLDAAVQMFELSARDYEGDRVLWKKGLDMLKQVDRSLSLPNLASTYQDFLSNLALVGVEMSEAS